MSRIGERYEFLGGEFEVVAERPGTPEEAGNVTLKVVEQSALAHHVPGHEFKVNPEFALGRAYVRVA